MDGLAVCRELRRIGVYTPILMLFARDVVDDRVAGLDAGAGNRLIKPFAPKELLARPQLADLTLDTVAPRVIRAGKTVDLTAKEYAVLECLMREPGRVLTRIIIAEYAWNFDVYNQSKRRSLRHTGGSG